MGIFKFNGKSYEVDMLDVDVLKTFEDGVNRLMENIDAIQADTETSAARRFEQILNEIDALFVAMFGKDVIRELFGKKRNLRDRFHAFTALMDLRKSVLADAQELSGMLIQHK